MPEAKIRLHMIALGPFIPGLDEHNASLHWPIRDKIQGKANLPSKELGVDP